MTKWILVLTTMLLHIMAATATAEGDTGYKEYRRNGQYEELFRIVYHKDDISVHTTEANRELMTQFPHKSITVVDGGVKVDGVALFDQDGLILEGTRRDLDQIIDVSILDEGDYFAVSFLAMPDDSQRKTRLKQGNRISFDRPIIIEEDEFVRGMALSIAGDIEVYGEVNKDVLSLFGNVYVGPAAVARGDLATLTGRVDVARDATVYGEMYTSDERRTTRRHRFRRRADHFDWTGRLNYNRVDGLLLGLGWEFEDLDSLLPQVWMNGAYAFASDRWRFDFGLEQAILRNPGLAVGGEYYRDLVSEDDWLLSDRENTAFALLVGEDYKDYYEAEGGWAYARMRPIKNLLLQVGYSYEETKWLAAHHNLWHLFGGDKRFCDNYATVDTSYRATLIREVDSTANGYLSVDLDWDTGDPDDRFGRSAWHVGTALEYAHPDLSSDFDYRRYMLTLTRFQRVHRRSMLILRGMYGGSDGYLPIYKRFFLGGLGTWRGYDHKEYMGTRFWMANTEYRTRFPGTDMAASILWDLGQIANEASLSSDVETKHSVGFALSFGDDLRISIAKRLDGSDDDPKIYVRLAQPF
jgi:hypothetical protein